VLPPTSEAISPGLFRLGFLCPAVRRSRPGTFKRTTSTRTPSSHPPLMGPPLPSPPLPSPPPCSPQLLEDGLPRDHARPALRALRQPRQPLAGRVLTRVVPPGELPAPAWHERSRQRGSQGDRRTRRADG